MKAKKTTGGAKAARNNGKGAANGARDKGLSAADRRRKAALEAEYAAFAERDRMREAELARRKTRSALAVLPAEVYKWLEGVADKANATPGEFAAAIVGAFHKFVMEGRATAAKDLPTTRAHRKDRTTLNTRRDDALLQARRKNALLQA